MTRFRRSHILVFAQKNVGLGLGLRMRMKKAAKLAGTNGSHALLRIYVVRIWWWPVLFFAYMPKFAEISSLPSREPLRELSKFLNMFTIRKFGM